jgi:hypothetical protein
MELFSHTQRSIETIPLKTLEHTIGNFSTRNPDPSYNAIADLIRRDQRGDPGLDTVLKKFSKIQNVCGQLIRDYLMSKKDDKQLGKESLSDDLQVSQAAKREILKRSSQGELIKACTNYSDGDCDWHCREAATELVRRAKECLTKEINNAFQSIMQIAHSSGIKLPSLPIVMAFIEESQRK